jgi:hypothetical protein
MPRKETSMTKRVKLCLILVTAALVLAGCPTAFFMGAIDLAGKTLFYYSDALDYNAAPAPNGHDFVMLRFDGTGKAGDFEAAYFTLDFPTQASLTPGNYTDMAWFQTDGQEGTFTYDPVTSQISFTMTKGYSPVLGAATIANIKGYASASYAYRSYTDYASFLTRSAVTAASRSLSANMQVAQDNLYYVSLPGTAANTWVTSITDTSTQTQTGTTKTITVSATITYTVTETALSRDVVIVTNDTSATPPKTAVVSSENYSVAKYFLAGKADNPGQTFAQVWSKGNNVSFQCVNTHSYTMMYTGDTAPAVPAADSNGAIAGVGAGWFCSGSDLSTPAVINLTHGGTYIYDTSQAYNPGRQLAAR